MRLQLVHRSVGYVVCVTRVMRLSTRSLGLNQTQGLFCIPLVFPQATSSSQKFSSTTHPSDHNIFQHHAEQERPYRRSRGNYRTLLQHLHLRQRPPRSLPATVQGPRCRRRFLHHPVQKGTAFQPNQRSNQRADQTIMTEHQRRPRQHPRLRPRPAERRRHQRLQVPELWRSSQRHCEQSWQEVSAEEGEG